MNQIKVRRQRHLVVIKGNRIYIEFEEVIKMKKVITYGTFDLFHVGHLNLLRRAKELGDYLIVAVSSDAFNALKGKKAYHPIEDRVKILEAIEYVDEVIIEESWNQKIDDVLSNNVDVFVMIVILCDWTLFHLSKIFLVTCFISSYLFMA